MLQPGGFTGCYEAPEFRFALLVNAPMAVIINGLQLLLCIAAVVMGKKTLVFSLSVAGLLFINGWMHIMGCVKAKGYAPGVITGVFLYLPLSTYAYYLLLAQSTNAEWSDRYRNIGLIVFSHPDKLFSSGICHPRT